MGGQPPPHDAVNNLANVKSAELFAAQWGEATYEVESSQQGDEELSTAPGASTFAVGTKPCSVEFINQGDVQGLFRGQAHSAPTLALRTEF